MDAVSVSLISIMQFCEWNDKRKKKKVAYPRSIDTRSLSLLKLLLLGLVWRFETTKRDTNGRESNEFLLGCLHK